MKDVNNPCEICLNQDIEGVCDCCFLDHEKWQLDWYRISNLIEQNVSELKKTQTRHMKQIMKLVSIIELKEELVNLGLDLKLNELLDVKVDSVSRNDVKLIVGLLQESIKKKKREGANT